MLRYQVVLVGYREKQVVIEALSDLYPEMSSQEVLYLAETLPATIEKNVSEATSSKVAHRLKSAGAVVEIEEYFLPFSQADSYHLTWVNENNVVEMYRFTYLPSFGRPVSIWIWQDEKDKIHALAQQSETPYSQQVFRKRAWKPDVVTWLQLTDLVDLNGFWESDTWEDRHWIDGAMWYFEGYRNGQYKVLKSWSPIKGAAYEVGMFFFHELVPDEFGDIEVF